MKPSLMNQKQLQTAIRNCLQKINMSFYQLGALIEAIRLSGQWKKWGGTEYDYFEDWCWNVLHFRERKAEQLAKIYVVLSELSIPKEWHQNLLDLGWSKLRLLSRVLNNRNYRKWHTKAEKLGYRALDTEVRIATGANLRPEGPEGREEGSSQAPEATGDSGGGENGGENGSQDADLKLILTFDHPDDMRHVQKALDVLEKQTKINNNGKLVGMLATSFLSFAARPHERGGLATTLKYMIESIESYFGVKLEVLKPLAKSRSGGGRKKNLKKRKKRA